MKTNLQINKEFLILLSILTILLIWWLSQSNVDTRSLSASVNIKNVIPVCTTAIHTLNASVSNLEICVEDVERKIYPTSPKTSKKKDKATTKLTTTKVQSLVILDKDVEEYIQNYWQLAKEEQKMFKIPASITLAQGIMESGKGKSSLAVEANNHFGIKRQGKSFSSSLEELTRGTYPLHDDCCKNKKCKKPDQFIHFSSVWASFRAHSQLLTNNRYKHLLNYGTDYKKWAYGLKKAGYATDSKYPEKIINIIEKYSLYLFDKN